MPSRGGLFKSPLRHVWVAGRRWLPPEGAVYRSRALATTKSFGVLDG